MIVDIANKKTDRQLRDVAELQKFEAIPDRLSELLEADEDELDIETMDFVVAASAAPKPNFERFKSYVKSHE